MTDTSSKSEETMSELQAPRPLAGRLKWVKIFFYLYMIVVGCLILSTSLAYFIFANGEKYFDLLSPVVAVETVLNAFTVVLYIGSVIAFCMFIFRAAKNIHIWDSTAMETSPGWTVGWWFIPFANLFKPYTVMSELWRASVDRNHANWMTPSYMPIWWFSWLLGNITNRISDRMLKGASNIDDVLMVVPISLVSLLFLFSSAYLSVRIVKGIAERQSDRMAVSSFT